MAKTSFKTIKELRGLSLEALQKEAAELSKKLSMLRSELAIGKLTNHAQIARSRKEIARIKTVAQEKIILKEITG